VREYVVVLFAEAKVGTGETAGSSSETSGGVVPEQKGKVGSFRQHFCCVIFKSFTEINFQDEAEANGGWLRVFEKVLRESDGGKQEVAEGSARA